MKNLEKRIYGYDPVYDRLDRKELLEHFKKNVATPWPGEEGLYSRRELINGLMGAEEEAWHEMSDDPEKYPIRRLDEKWGPASTLTRPKGQRLYWCWAGDPLAAAIALVADPDSYDWILPTGVRAGDLILTILGTEVPLVVAVEVVESALAEAVTVERLATFSNPVSVEHIEEKLDFSLPRSSELLLATVADKILVAIAELVDSPLPIFVEAGVCLPVSCGSTHEMIAVVSLLQEGAVEKISCDGCGQAEPIRLEPHLFRMKLEDTWLELQDHVDDTALLCVDCHTMVHRPQLEELRRFSSAPACPECGERNPKSIIWGMPVGPPSDDEVVAGCAIPPGIIPEWMCRECETQYKVVGYREGLGLAFVDSQGVPLVE